MFSILKFPPRVLLYSTPSIISRKMSFGAEGWYERTIFAIHGKVRESPSCRYFSLGFTKFAPGFFQISRHVEHIMPSQIFFIEAPRYQTNRPIYF